MKKFKLGLWGFVGLGWLNFIAMILEAMGAISKNPLTHEIFFGLALFSLILMVLGLITHPIKRSKEAIKWLSH